MGFVKVHGIEQITHAKYLYNYYTRMYLTQTFKKPLEFTLYTFHCCRFFFYYLLLSRTQYLTTRNCSNREKFAWKSLIYTIQFCFKINSRTTCKWRRAHCICSRWEKKNNKSAVLEAFLSKESVRIIHTLTFT